MQARSSATNSCQQADAAKSPGKNPCTELERHAGLWRFDATARDSNSPTASAGDRDAQRRGDRRSRTTQVWAAVHGRDQLGANWGFSDEANANNPPRSWCRSGGRRQLAVLLLQQRRAPEGGAGVRRRRPEGRALCQRKAPATPFRALGADGIGVLPGPEFGPLYQGGLFTFHGVGIARRCRGEGFRVAFAPFRGQADRILPHVRDASGNSLRAGGGRREGWRLVHLGGQRHDLAGGAAAVGGGA